MQAPIIRQSLPDQVFERLRESILSGAYEPGEQLPPQRALAGRLEVNIASVREALKRLEQLRLVDVRHGDCTRVLDWRRSGGLEALALHTGVEDSLAADLFEARQLLLVEAARLAAGRRSEEQAGALADLARAVALAPDDATALLADWSFMFVLVEAAGNLVFQLILNSVRELYLPRAEEFAPLVADRERIAGLYAKIAEAIERGDERAAARATGVLASAQAAGMLASAQAAGMLR